MLYVIWYNAHFVLCICVLNALLYSSFSIATLFALCYICLQKLSYLYTSFTCIARQLGHFVVLVLTKCAFCHIFHSFIRKMFLFTQTEDRFLAGSCSRIVDTVSRSLIHIVQHHPLETRAVKLWLFTIGYFGFHSSPVKWANLHI